MKNASLLEQVKTRTKETMSKGKTTFSTKQWFVDNLLNNKKSKVDIIAEIATARIETFNPDYKSLKPEELQKLIDKTMITAKNGVETTVANSQNNSAFSFDPAYAEYELIKYGSMAYEVKRRS